MMKNSLRQKIATLVIMLFLIGKSSLGESLSFLSLPHLNTGIEQVEKEKIISFISVEKGLLETIRKNPDLTTDEDR